MIFFISDKMTHDPDPDGSPGTWILIRKDGSKIKFLFSDKFIYLRKQINKKIMIQRSAVFNNKVFISGFTRQSKAINRKDFNSFALICSYVKQGDQSNIYDIEKAELIKALKLHRSSCYRDLRITLANLQTYVFNVESPDKPTDSRIRNLYKHDNFQKAKTIKFTFDPDLHKLLTNIDPVARPFTRIQVDQILKYKKATTKLLYIHLATYQPGSVLHYTIDQIKELLDLSHKYPDTSDLFKRAIVPAVNDMFESDLPISIAEIWDSDPEKRKGKKITGVTIKLLIAKSKDPDSSINNVNPDLTLEKRNQLAGWITGVLKLSNDQADHLINRVPVKQLITIGKGIEKNFSESRSGIRSDEKKIKPEKYSGYTAKVFRNIFRTMDGDILSKKYIPFVAPKKVENDSNYINQIGLPVTGEARK